MNYRIKEIVLPNTASTNNPVSLFFPQYEDEKIKITGWLTFLCMLFCPKQVKNVTEWCNIASYKGKVKSTYNPYQDTIVCCDTLEQAREIILEHKQIVEQERIQYIKTHPHLIESISNTTIHSLYP